MTFKQDTRLSRDTLILEGSRLVVSTDVAGLHNEKAISVRDISPASRRYQKRFAAFVIVPFGVGVALWWVASALLRQDEIDHAIVVAPIVGLIVALWYLTQGLRGIPAVQFFDKKGKVLVEVFGPKGKALACDEFVIALTERIKAESAEKNEPNQVPEPMSGLAPGHGAS